MLINWYFYYLPKIIIILVINHFIAAQVICFLLLLLNSTLWNSVFIHMAFPNLNKQLGYLYIQ